LAQAEEAPDLLRARAVTNLQRACRQALQDLVRVPRDLLVRVSAQRELELAVFEQAADAKARSLTALQGVRLVLGKQTDEVTLHDHEQPDLRLVAPGF